MKMAIKTVININTLTDNKRFLKLLAANTIARMQETIEIPWRAFIFCSHEGK